MVLKRNRRVLLGTTNLPSPRLDLNYVSAMALAGTETFTRASTGWYFNSAGVLTSAATDAPRFDYDPATLLPKGLLMEETRTNLALQSQTLDNASWTKATASVTANSVTAPDGTLTADTLVEDNTTAAHQVSQLYSSILSATAYTASVYAKAGTRTFLRLSLSSGTGFSAEQGYTFNLSTGALGVVIGTATAVIQSVGNGWYRCSITATSTGAGAASVVLRLFNGASTYAGDGTSGLYLWGAQLEAGAFATSYIGPTAGSTVARAADICTISSISGFFNASAGALISDWAVEGVRTTGIQTVASLDDGTNSHRISIFATNTGGITQASGSAGSTFMTVTRATAPVVNAIDRMAITWDVEASRVFLNGSFLSGGSAGGAPAATQMRIGHRTTDQLTGWLRRVRVYDRRLLDAMLALLTS